MEGREKRDQSGRHDFDVGRGVEQEVIDGVPLRRRVLSDATGLPSLSE